MSGLIDRAEQRGLVARERSAEDGRAVDVFMTKAGSEARRTSRGRRTPASSRPPPVASRSSKWTS